MERTTFPPSPRLRRAAAALAGLIALLLTGCASMGIYDTPPEDGGAASGPESRRAAAAAGVDAGAAFTEGEEAFVDEDWQGAVEAYGRAVRLDPRHGPAWAGLAKTHGKLGDHKAALEAWDQAVRLAPGDARIRGDRAECLWRLDEYEQAIEELDRALSVVQDDDNWTLAWLHALKGDSLRLLERHEEADPELTEAVERMPDYVFALARRGENRRMLGLLEESILDLDRAIEEAPGESFAWASRGQAHHQLEMLDQALADLDKALELQPDYPWAADRRKEVLEKRNASGAGGGVAASSGGAASGGAKTGGAVGGGRAASPASVNLPLVAVMDFQVENLAASEGRLIVDLLSSALASRQVFRVLERSQRDAVLKEIEFSSSECAEESCQLKAGRLLAADRIVVGSLGRVGGRYILNAKLLQVETGEVAATAYQVYRSLDELVDGCETIAFTLSGI